MPAEDTTTAPVLTLLGPQRNPRLDSVLTDLGISGRVALINAGWREREPDDELLASQAGGSTVNLKLWQRMQAVWEADPAFADADRRRRETLEELQELYLLGLDHVVSAIIALVHRTPRNAALGAQALADAEQVMRQLDRQHLARVAEVHAEFWAAWPPHERPAVATLRGLVAQELADAEAVVIPGGHVGVLVGALHLFNVAPLLRAPVIAWGAGAMALTDTVVLFHDRAVHGPAVAEVFSAGVGLVHEVVALPGARARLDLSDTARMGIFARRFAPARLLLLDENADVRFGPDGKLPPGARTLGSDGSVLRDHDVRDRPVAGVLP